MSDLTAYGRRLKAIWMPAMLPLAAVVAAFLILACLNLLVPSVISVDMSGAADIIDKGLVAPEPRERLMFLWFVSLTFLMVLLLGTAARRSGWTSSAIAPGWVLCMIAIAAIVLSAPDARNLAGLILPVIPTSVNILLLVLVLSVVLSAIAVIASEKRDGLVFGVMLAGLLGVAAIATLSNGMFSPLHLEYPSYVFVHFDAVTYSVAMASDGYACLADYRAQYGCYSQYIAPVLLLVGRSIWGVTSVYTALALCCWLAAMSFVLDAVRSRALQLAAGALLLVAMNAMPFLVGGPDRYFQYMPIRVFVPALSLVAARAYQRSPGNRRALLLGLFAGFGLTWNIDSGVPVVGALLFFILFRFAAPWRERMLQAAVYAAGAALYLVVFWSVLSLTGSHAVNPLAVLQYQKIFYQFGFAMLPMPGLPALWAIPVVVLTVALVSFFGGLFRDRKQGELVAFVSVLAIGLFVYYTGRSHVVVFTLPCWALVLVLIIMTDAMVGNISSDTLRKAFSMCLVTASFLLTGVVLPHSLSVANLPDNPSASNVAQLSEDIAFLERHAERNERVGLVAPNAALLLFGSGLSQALPQASVTETLRYSDLDALSAAIDRSGPAKLFIGPPGRIPLFPVQRLDLQHYRRVEAGPGDRITYFERID